MNQQTNELSKR